MAFSTPASVSGWRTLPAWPLRAATPTNRQRSPAPPLNRADTGRPGSNHTEPWDLGHARVALPLPTTGILPIQLGYATAVRIECDLAAIRRPYRVVITVRIESDTFHRDACKIEQPDVIVLGRIPANDSHSPAVRGKP